MASDETSGKRDAAPADPLVGQRLGDYELLARIGGGPVTAIYQARQASADRVVALKVLAEPLCQIDFAVSRFETEATLAAAIAHPNVVAIYGWGCVDDRLFIVMEHMDGESLASALQREERLPAERALPVMKDLARAVGAVHEAGLLHFGIQPSNVLLGSDGTVRLADFGLARHLDEDPDPKTPTEFLEAPFYYPPEATRARPLDERADLYQLGGLFYHIIAGQPPFPVTDPESTALRYARENVPPLSQVLRSAPVALVALIHKLLARDPAARYESAEQVVEALERIEAMFERTLAARRAQAAAEEPKPKRREKRERRREEEPAPRPTIAERAEAAQKRQKQTLVLTAVAVGITLILGIVVLVILPLWPEQSPPTSFDVTHDPPAPASQGSPKGISPAPRTRTKPTPSPKPVTLAAAEAVIHGEARYESGGGKDSIGYWLKPDDWVHWEFDLAGPGTYQVRIVFAAAAECRGSEYEIRVAGQTLYGKVYETGGWTEFVTQTVGTVTVKRAGAHRLEVRCRKLRRTALMNLKSVSLLPMKRGIRP